MPTPPRTPQRPARPGPRGPGLAALPNLGPRSQALLHEAGIADEATLRRLGAVAAYARVKARHGAASLNLLWALEGALTGLPWQEVARQHRTSLLLGLEQHLQQGHPGTGHRMPAATAVPPPPGAT